MLGIIGGTGLTQLANLKIKRRQIMRTPYGEPSGPLSYGDICGYEVVFLPRHGHGHAIPPHLVNYRANIWALHSEGVREIISIGAVCGITQNLSLGMITLPDQIIDYTHGRKNTFFDGGDLPVNHIDFTEPYCPHLRSLCLEAAGNIGETLLDGGVYACVQGPRLDTAAEINRLEKDGATLVGMTGMPEAALARELEMRYAALCPIVNYAAGRGGGKHDIQSEDMSKVLNGTMELVRKLIERVVVGHAC